MKSTIDQVTRQAKAQRKVLNLEFTETRAEVAKAKVSAVDPDRKRSSSGVRIKIKWTSSV